jgi:anaerobic ribonucleoside-triphosphate reductase
MKNEKAVEDIIDYAMSLDIPYLAFNFPIDSCLKCGYQGEIGYNCPKCGNTEIQRLRRVTGYLTTDYRNFNAGKIKECLDRVKHSNYTDFNQMKDDAE